MRALALLCLAAAACGDPTAPPATTCATPPTPLPVGDPDGHPQPLGAGPTEARAGRLTAADLPPVPSGLLTWKPGDFVLANDRVALVIEDVGDSDLYDPWGGRPVGLAQVAGGKLVAPSNFGELFLLTGRSTVVTDSVSVIADGTGGGPAIIRARGKLHPLPFFEAVAAVVFNERWLDVDAAIDYELAPGSDHVDVRYRYASPRLVAKELPALLHGLMYTKRTPAFVAGVGFDTSTISNTPYLGLVDDAATSWAYLPGSGLLGAGLSVAGFLGATTDGFTMPACGNLDRLHAQIVIGGPGLDGLQAAVARTRGTATRALDVTVTRGGVAAAGVRVHATDSAAGGAGYLTRATTDATGHVTLHVPTGLTVHLDAFRRGDVVGAATVAPADGAAAIDLPGAGAIHVVVTDPAGGALPARVQILPGAGQPIPSVPTSHGEPEVAAGRLHVAYALTGDVTLPAPPGAWRVVVSRGYEYDLVDRTVDVTAGATVQVDATLDRVVDTAGVQCGDFHVHTWRSNDSGDDARDKVAQAVADGLELPVRSEHEYVADFSAEIAALGVGAWAAAIGSIELTSFEIWGHMGVFPLVPDPAAVNAGAPRWQTFPTADAPTTPFATLAPPQVFDVVRARPEAPVVIINHPRGGANYFDYVGYDPATGLVSSAPDWDSKFTLVEVFNDSGWQANRGRNVTDWLGLLRAGRQVFAVGSSDSHGIATSPVGYPRTCIALGTDDPRQVTPTLVRDQLAAGHATISGGIYVTATIAGRGPGETATGLPGAASVDVRIQAAPWVDVTALELIVDGQTVDTVPILPADADPGNPVIRWRGALPFNVAASGGFVVVAAYGTAPLEPVHPGRIPFGMTNPIFVK